MVGSWNATDLIVISQHLVILVRSTCIAAKFFIIVKKILHHRITCRERLNEFRGLNRKFNYEQIHDTYTGGHVLRLFPTTLQSH